METKNMSIEESQGLGRLSNLVKALRIAEQAVVDSETLLKNAKETYNQISEQTIPELMQQLELEEIKLRTGEKLSVAKVYHAKIPANREEEAFEWLRDNELGSIIKDIVIKKTNVHHQTLKAVVKERYEDGKDIPEVLFGIYVKNVTKITNK